MKYLLKEYLEIQHREGKKRNEKKEKEKLPHPHLSMRRIRERCGKLETGREKRMGR